MRTMSCLRIALGGFLAASSLASNGQQPASPASAKAVPRVTTHLKATPLPDALKELTRLTGVSMKASVDAAALKVTILVKDLPLDALRTRLAETLHMTWMPVEGKPGQPPAYMLYRSAANKAEEQERLGQGEKAFRKGIEEAIEFLILSPADQKRSLAERSAMAETFSRDSGKVAVTLFSYLSPRQRISIIDGKKMAFPADMPPAELAPHIDEIIKAFKASIPDASVAGTFDQGGKRFTVERIGEGAESLIRVTFSVQDEKGSASLGFGIRGVRVGRRLPGCRRSES